MDVPLAFSPADLATVEQAWRERWGDTLIVSVGRDYRPADVEGLTAHDDTGAMVALVTWNVVGDAAEIVSLDAFAEGHGYGRRVLREALQRLGERGVERAHLYTTNDNVDAIRLYLLEGWRVTRIHFDEMDRVREKKPMIPLEGAHGLPLQDMWRLERRVDG